MVERGDEVCDREPKVKRRGRERAREIADCTAESKVGGELAGGKIREVAAGLSCGGGCRVPRSSAQGSRTGGRPLRQLALSAVARRTTHTRCELEKARARA